MNTLPTEELHKIVERDKKGYYAVYNFGKVFNFEKPGWECYAQRVWCAAPHHVTRDNYSLEAARSAFIREQKELIEAAMRVKEIDG